MAEKVCARIPLALSAVFPVPARLAGLPAISVRAGLSAGGLPLGLQLVGRPFDQGTVLGAAHALEAAAGFDARPPGLDESV